MDDLNDLIFHWLYIIHNWATNNIIHERAYSRGLLNCKIQFWFDLVSEYLVTNSKDDKCPINPQNCNSVWHLLKLGFFIQLVRSHSQTHSCIRCLWIHMDVLHGFASQNLIRKLFLMVIGVKMAGISGEFWILIVL